MKVNYYDENGRYTGWGETYSMVPMATEKPVPEDVPDGKEPIFNVDLGDWELVDLPVPDPINEPAQ